MDTAPAFGFNELFAAVLGDIAKAVCARGGETKQQYFARSQAAVHMTMSFLPRDVIEAMLAGHCVMIHETMLAGTHETLIGQDETMRHGTRSNLVALNKEFNSTLSLLGRYQARPAEGRRDMAADARAGVAAQNMQPMAAQGESSVRTVHPAAETPSTVTQAAAAAQTPVTDTLESLDTEPRVAAVSGEPDGLIAKIPGAPLVLRPSPEAMAECRANPEAMAALEAGDPWRFARAMGVEVPSEEFLEAANSPGSPFDRNATGPWPVDQVAGSRKT